MDALFTNLLNLLKDFFYWCANTVIEILASLITAIGSILPTYSLPEINVNTSYLFKFTETLNWVIPIDVFLLSINAFVFSSLLYFSVGTLTRWAKITN